MPSTPPASPPAYRTALALAAILGLALALGLRGSDYALWYDEIASTRFAAQPWQRLWSDWMVYETNPPLYYSLLKLWLALVGDSDSGVRLLSTLLGLGGIACAWLLGRILAGTRAGLVAAVLVAVSQQHVFYGQMARSYVLGHSATLLALVGLARLAQAWQGEGAAAQRARAGALAVYAIGAGIAVYSHTTLVLVPVLANLWALPRLAADWWHERRWPRPLAGWIAANLAVLAAWSWWGRVTWLQSTGMGANIGWIARPSLPYAVRMTLESYVPWGVGPAGGGVAGAAGAVLFGGLFGWGLWRHRAALCTRGFDLLAAFAIGAPALLFALSLARPVFLPRTVYFAAGPFLVGVAVGLACLPRRWFWGGLAAALALEAAAYSAWYRQREIEPWRAVAAAVEAPGAPRTVVVKGIGPALALARYCDRPGCGRQVLIIPSPQVDHWAGGMAPPIEAKSANPVRALRCGEPLVVLRWSGEDPAAALPPGSVRMAPAATWGPGSSLALSRWIAGPCDVR